jgi:hypothetical protein
VFLMRQFISGLPDELIEADRIDGAGHQVRAAAGRLGGDHRPGDRPVRGPSALLRPGHRHDWHQVTGGE